MQSRATRGFTLIEILVVIGIIGLLIGLTLPAVVHVREVGRRASCNDHLRQLGIALQQHHSAKGRYPSIFAGREKDERGRTFATGPSGFYDLLPYLDQIPLYQSWVFEKGGKPVIEWSDENRTVRQTVIGTLLCPSDGGLHFDGFAPTSYRFNTTIVGPQIGDITPIQGGDSFTNGSLHSLAALDLVRGVRAKDIRDGSANTVGMSERVVGGRGPSFNPRRDLWYAGVHSMYQPETPRELADLCGSLQGIPQQSSTNFGLFWSGSMQQDCRYNHVHGPNSRVPDCTTLEGPASTSRGVELYDAAVGARSEHSGGVHCLYMDGSVRFASEGISRAVWWALGTRSGGEVVSAPDR